MVRAQSGKYLAVKASAGLLFVILVGLLSYRLVHSIWRANLAHLQLARTLVSGGNIWSEWIVGTTLFEYDLRTLPQFVSRNVYEESISSFGCGADDPSCDLLLMFLQTFAVWHHERNRPQLSQVFVAMNHIYHQDDTSAIHDLSLLNASGILFDVGVALGRQQQVSRAILYLETALMLQPTGYGVIRQLAILYLGQQRYCEAVGVSRRGVQHYPDTPLFYYYLGRAYEGLGMWREATNAYQQAVARFPDHESYKRRLLYAEKQTEKAPTVNLLDVCKQVLPVNGER